jgi:hypothetical protein
LVGKFLAKWGVAIWWAASGPPIGKPRPIAELIELPSLQQKENLQRGAQWLVLHPLCETRSFVTKNVGSSDLS